MPSCYVIYLVLGGDEWEETWATYYRSFIDTLLMALACQTGKNFVSSVYWLVEVGHPIGSDEVDI